MGIRGRTVGEQYVLVIGRPAESAKRDRAAPVQWQLHHRAQATTATDRRRRIIAHGRRRGRQTAVPGPGRAVNVSSASVFGKAQGIASTEVMHVFAFLVFAVVVGVMAWVLYSAIRQARGGHRQVQVPWPDLSRTGRLWAWLLGAIAVLYMLRASVVIVPGAHVACVYDPLMGGIQSYTLPEGLRFIFPWCKAEIFRTQTQEYTMSIAAKEGAVIGDDSIRCETNEGLKVLLDLTVLFHIDAQRAPELWRKLGADYNHIFVRPAARERIRMVVARYSIQEVYSSRRSKIEEELTEELRKPFADEGLVLEQILLRNVQYAHEEFAQAIGEKQARQQQVITERRNLERAEFEKQATINQAKGEARSIALRAQTLAQNPEVVTYDMAQKIGPRVRRAYLSEGTVPLPRVGGGR